MTTLNKTRKNQITDQAENLIYEFTLNNFPIELESEWKPIEQVYELLKQDKRLALHFLEVAGVISSKGVWDQRLIQGGLIIQQTVVESDLSTGFHRSIEIILVSDLGYRFLSAFFDLPL